MKFTKIVYGIAAAYGFISLLPLYFLIGRVGHDAPPPITHPEFYYGFLGVTLLWQIVFVLIARDPHRYRPIMPLAILEKFIYSVPVLMLFLTGRVHSNIVRSSFADPIFGILFIMAYFRMRTKINATVVANGQRRMAA